MCRRRKSSSLSRRIWGVGVTTLSRHPSQLAAQPGHGVNAPGHDPYAKPTHCTNALSSYNAPKRCATHRWHGGSRGYSCHNHVLLACGRGWPCPRPWIGKEGGSRMQEKSPRGFPSSRTASDSSQDEGDKACKQNAAQRLTTCLLGASHLARTGKGGGTSERSS